MCFHVWRLYQSHHTTAVHVQDGRYNPDFLGCVIATFLFPPGCPPRLQLISCTISVVPGSSASACPPARLAYFNLHPPPCTAWNHGPPHVPPSTSSWFLSTSSILSPVRFSLGSVSRTTAEAGTNPCGLESHDRPKWPKHPHYTCSLLQSTLAAGLKRQN